MLYTRQLDLRDAVAIAHQEYSLLFTLWLMLLLLLPLVRRGSCFGCKPLLPQVQPSRT